MKVRRTFVAIALAGICSLISARGGAAPEKPPASKSRKAPEARGAPRPRSDAEIERRLLEYRAQVARATLLVVGESCAGFVAEAPNLVVTAAHCIPYPKRRASVRLPTGQTLMARLDRIDRDTDLALLRLPEALPVVPLVLSERVPAAGDRVLFVGRADRGNEPQLARVKKLDRCPSLPRVPKAVFTSVNARPGDSGSPLVDANLRVVGLVHGGAQCHIAAPVAPLARQLANERDTVFAAPWLPAPASRWPFALGAPLFRWEQSPWQQNPQATAIARRERQHALACAARGHSFDGRA